MRFIFNKKIKQDKIKKSQNTPVITNNASAIEEKSRRNNNEESTECMVSHAVEPISIRNNEKHEGVLKNRRSSDLLASVSDPFGIQNAVEPISIRNNNKDEDVLENRKSFDLRASVSDQLGIQNAVEPISIRNNEQAEGVLQNRRSSDLRASVSDPFGIPRTSIQYDACCQHQQEIDNLRLLVMKLNRRLYFAEMDTPSDSNDSLLAQKSTPDWIKEPEETCALLERAEKRLEEQTVLLNEYESTMEVLRNNLEAVTTEKEKLVEQLKNLRAEKIEKLNGTNHSPTFDHMLWDPSGNANTDNLLKENQKLAEFIHEKHKHDVKMYRLVGDQLQQMMQQVYQLASRRSSVASESLPSTSFERINQTPITIYYKDKRHKHGFGRFSRKSDRHAVNVMADGDLSEMANKLGDIERQMSLLTQTVNSRRLSQSQTIHHS